MRKQSSLLPATGDARTRRDVPAPSFPFGAARASPEGRATRPHFLRMACERRIGWLFASSGNGRSDGGHSLRRDIGHHAMLYVCPRHNTGGLPTDGVPCRTFSREILSDT